jgi:hypothetical protein
VWRSIVPAGASRLANSPYCSGIDYAEDPDHRRHPARRSVPIEEIRARHGPIIAVTHPGELPVAVDAAFEVPASEPEFDPILLNIPLQLLAYHVALKKGCDIDQTAQSSEIGNCRVRNNRSNAFT